MAIQLKQNADASAGLQGTDLDDGGFIVFNMPWSSITNTTGSFLTISGPILNRRMIVKAISYSNDATATNAVTASIVKAATAVAISAGTALHTGTANLQATANANQAMTLALAGVLDIAAGNRIGFVISAAPGAAGNGSFTVTLAPA